MISFSECRSLISEIGFPVFVAIYLLIYLERSLRRLTACLSRLIALQEQHNEEERLHHQSEILASKK